MNYYEMTIAELEALYAELYATETAANLQRKEVKVVLDLKLNQRAAGELVEEAQAMKAEADAALFFEQPEPEPEPSFLDKVKQALGV